MPQNWLQHFRLTTSAALLAAYSLVALSPLFSDTNFPVTSSADSGAGTLRQAILQSNAAPPTSFNTITINTSSVGGPISISAMLPHITQNVQINTSSGTQTITGPGYARIFYIEPNLANVAINNIIINNAVASGGSGGTAGGGGALAAGAGLFIREGASVTIQGMSFNNSQAFGGGGAGGSSTVAGGGGGGLSANGGSGGTITSGSAGGGAGGGMSFTGGPGGNGSATVGGGGGGGCGWIGPGGSGSSAGGAGGGDSGNAGNGDTTTTYAGGGGASGSPSEEAGYFGGTSSANTAGGGGAGGAGKSGAGIGATSQTGGAGSNSTAGGTAGNNGTSGTNGEGGGGGGGSSTGSAGQGGSGSTDTTNTIGGGGGGGGGSSVAAGGAGGAGGLGSGGGGGGAGHTNGGAGGNGYLSTSQIYGGGGGGGGGGDTGSGGTGGNGGVNGGGGGGGSTVSGSVSGNGGAGGFGGGGGGGAFSNSATSGGAGGEGGFVGTGSGGTSFLFGGGAGGAGGAGSTSINGATGGFGAGGGGGYGASSTGGTTFYGGGSGAPGAAGTIGAGGGGAAFGGVIFLQANTVTNKYATLTITDPITLSGSQLFPGGGGGTGATGGSSAGVDIYMMSGTTLILDITGSFTLSTDLASDQGQVGSLTSGGLIISGAGTVTLSNSGNTYTGGTHLNNGTLSISSDGNFGFVPSSATNNIFFGGGILQSTGSSVTLSTNRNVSLTANTTIKVTGASTNSLTIPGVISQNVGPYSLTLPTAHIGTLVLSGSNSYSGGTIINGGTLSISADANLGTAPGSPATNITLGGGTFKSTGTSVSLNTNRNISLTASSSIDVTSSNALTIPSVISGAFTLSKTDTGTLTLQGTNTYGSTTISGGILSISADANLGTAPGSPTTNITLGGGALQSTAASLTLNTNRNISLTASSSIDVTGSNALTIPSVISGAFTLSKTDTGTLTLQGTNTYGSTTISGGTLSISADANLGTAPGSPSTNITLSGGTLQSTAASLSLNTNRNISLTSNSSIDVTSSNALTIPSVISGAFTLSKIDTGTLTLQGTNTYGSTSISGGILSISSDSNLGTAPGSPATNITLGGGTLQSTGSSLSLNSKRNISLTANSSIDVTSSNALTIPGIISGAFTLSKIDTGTLTLQGTNTYGSTSISGGILSISSDSNLGTAPGTPTTNITLGGGTLQSTGASLSLNSNRYISLTANGTIQVTGSSTNTLTIPGVISQSPGPYSLTLPSANVGIVVLQGTNTFSGGTVIDAGVLSISADANLGTAPGSPSTNITLSGGTLQSTASSLSLNSNRNISLTASSSIDVTSNNALTIPSIISGAFTLSKTDTGTLTLQGINTYGSTAISGGILSISADANLGTAPGTPSTNITLSGGTLQSTAASLSLNANRNISLTASSSIDVTSSNALTIPSVISGAFTLTKSDTGTLTLQGLNSYGSTSISGGTLSISADSNLGTDPGSPTTNITLSGGTLQSTAASLTLNTNRNFSLTANSNISVTGSSSNTFTIPAMIAGSFSLTMPSTNVGTIIFQGINSYSGGTIINAGTLSISSDANLGTAPGSPSTNITLGGGTLQSTAASLTLNTNRNFSLTANSNISVTGSSTNTLTIPGVISENPGPYSLTLPTTNTGIVVLQGSNTFSRGTVIDAGILSISTDSNLGTAPNTPTTNITLSGGTLQSTATLPTFSLNTNRNISLTSNSSIDVVSSAYLTIPSVISGAFILSKIDTGTLTLQGNNTYDSTVINGGILSISTDSNLGTAPGSPTTNITLSGGTLQSTAASLSLNTNRYISLTASSSIDVTGSNALTIPSVISGAFTLSKIDTGMLTLQGLNTYGSTTISGGALSISADANLGTAPGSPSTNITLSGGALQSTAASLTLNTNRNISLTANSSIDVTGSNALTIPSVISGAFTLSKIDTGMLTLQGLNTYGSTTISGGTLSISSDSNLGTAPGSPTTNITLSGGALQSTAASLTLNMNRNISLTANSSIDVTSSNALTIPSVISGAFTLSKIDTGMLTLQGTNTYGSTTIGGGVLSISADANLGTAPGSPSTNISLNGGALQSTATSLTLNMNRNISLTANSSIDVTSSNALTIPSVISGAFTLSKTDTGTLTLQGLNTYGSTLISGGILSISSDSNLGTVPGTPTTNITLNGGAIQSTAASLTLNANRNISLTANGTIQVTGSSTNTLTLPGVISESPGPYSLTLPTANVGIVVLQGSNSFSGGTNINTGVLSISSDSNLGTVPGTPTTNITLNGGTLQSTAASLTLNANRNISLTASSSIDVTSSNALTIPGVISGAFILSKTDTGILTLQGTNSYGSTVINGGILSISADANLGAIPGSSITNITLAGGTLQSTAASLTLNMNRNISLTASSSIDVTGSNTLTISSIISGAFTLSKTNTGMLTLQGLNTYGSTTISGGILSISSDSNLGTAPGSPSTNITLGGGILQSTAASLTLNMNRNISLTADSSIDVTSSNALMIPSAISGAFTLSKIDTGVLTLIGTNSYTGGTNLTSGTLAITTDSNLGAGTSSLTLSAGTILQANGSSSLSSHTITLGGAATIDTNSNPFSISSVISGSGPLTKISPGTLTLSGTNSYTSTTSVNAGILAITTDANLGTARVA